MKISKSKQELARIISENGGWRDGAEWATQDNVVASFSGGKPDYSVGDKVWCANGDDGVFIVAMSVDSKIKGFHNTILSREEYFHLYPAPDADGWIEWKGGECPVEKGAVVDVIWRNGTERAGVKALHIGGAGHKFWVADGMVNDIIAYRPHKSEQSKPEFCESVMRSIPEPDEPVWTNPPSIEHLAADYRAKLAIATQAQEEADSHRCGAEVALSKLEIAVKEFGFEVEPITAKQEPELAITDWRDLQTGDLVWVEEEGGRVAEGEYEVLEVEVPDYDGKRTIRIRGGEGGQFWINYENGWRFIRRP